MTSLTRRHLTFCFLASLAASVPIAAAAAGEPPVFSASLLGHVAINGYDPVAYFTEGRPVEGRRDLSHEWNGATWRFASEESRARFAADPAAYAPQYGGYCAYAVSEGYTAKTDPDAWRIEGGKLYLNYDKEVQKLWEQDIPGRIARADANWPAVLEK